jgi:hypothetical protein
MPAAVSRSAKLAAGITIRRQEIHMHRIPTLALLLAAALATVACSREPGPAERAGRAIDEAAKKTSQALQRAGEKTGAALEQAGEKVGESAQKVGDAVGRGVEATGQAIERAGKSVQEAAKK